MADDKDLNISFDIPTLKFTLPPDPIPMHAAGTIKFHRYPTNAPWHFTGGNVKDGKWDSKVQDQGATLALKDEFKDLTLTEHHYYVVIEDKNGTTHQSEDPVIVNDPGRPDGTTRRKAKKGKAKKAKAKKGKARKPKAKKGRAKKARGAKNAKGTGASRSSSKRGRS